MNKTLQQEQKDMRERMRTGNYHAESTTWGGRRVKGNRKHGARENTPERWVKEFLTRAGYKVYRNGWPDYLATKGDKAVFVEVKSLGDRLSSDQKEMHKALKTIGIEVLVVRPQEEALHKKFSL